MSRRPKAAPLPSSPLTDRFYAGVGSRETPKHICRVMTELAEWLYATGWSLRSGHAEGADRAFEAGARGRAEILLPWSKYGTKPYKADPGAPILGHAVSREEEWKANYADLRRLGIRTGPIDPDPTKLLLGRDVAQVKGWSGSPRPSRFVVCWTRADANGAVRGGTAVAIRTARIAGIPVFNFHLPGGGTDLDEWMAAEGTPLPEGLLAGMPPRKDEDES